MQLLVIGSGGREHALVWSLSQSSSVTHIYALPGNAGINQLATPVSLDPDAHDDIVHFCKENAIDIVIVGPEAPLVAGLADTLRTHNILTLGPSAAAAQLEGSKRFAKDLCAKYNIPTGAYESFTDAESAKAYLHTQSLPIVIKADGLAAGKGVIIAETQEDAINAIDEMFSGKFGEAGNVVVIEEFLEGEEASFFALSDGTHVIPFGSAQDHKRVGEGDTGPNTGGMGTYSPAPVMANDMEDVVMRDIVHPTIEAMEKEGTPYQGILFVGLMITETGPKVIEYNVRFGDPEAQVLLPRLKNDFATLAHAACEGTLDQQEVTLQDQSALCVVMASNGYPGSYTKGTQIQGLEKAGDKENVIIFHAGTTEKDGVLLATGGRVLGVTALGDSIIEAQTTAYEAVDTIDWPEGFCRRDIGWRAIKRLEMAS